MPRQMLDTPSEDGDAEDRDGLRRRHLRDGDKSATEAVLGAVATALNTDVESLPPLGERLDTDCLDGLFDSRTRSAGAGLVFARTEELDADLELQFQYAGFDVTLTENYIVLE